MQPTIWHDASTEDAAQQDTLIDQLRLAGLHYLGGGTRRRPPAWPPDVLLRTLATCSEPRLRLALVALLLRQPVLAARVRTLA